MLILIFSLTSLLVILFSIGVSYFAEKVESSLITKSAIVGMILLALATSLPEITTAIITARDNRTELLLSNVLGSNFFNLLILAAMQLIFWKDNIFSKIPKTYLFSYVLLLIMHIVIFLSLGFIHTTNLFTFIPSIILVLLYYFTIKVSPGSQSDIIKTKDNLLRSCVLFFIFSFFLVISAIILVQTVEELSRVYQLSSLFAGSILIGVITSLPELVASITLSKRKQHTLLIEAIIGSNILNFFILVIGDFMVLRQSIFHIEPIFPFLMYLFLLTIASLFIFLAIFIKPLHQNKKRFVPYIMSILLFILYIFTFFI